MIFAVFKGLKVVNKGIIIGLELLVVVAVIFVGFVSYGLFCLSRGPIDLSFAQSYIEKAFADQGRDVQFKVRHATASWRDLKGPLTLHLAGLSMWRGALPLLEIKDVSIAIAKAPLLVGLIRPERLIVEGPTLTLERTPEGKLHFALSDVKTDKESDMTAFVRDMLKGLRGQEDYGIFSRIRAVDIRAARLRVADQQQGMTWQLNNVSSSFERTDVGIYGSLSVQLPNDQNFSAVLLYHHDRDTLTFSSQFRDFALVSMAGRLMGIDWLRHQRLPLTGRFNFELGLQDFKLGALQVQAHAKEGLLDIRGIMGHDMAVQDVAIDLAFNRRDRKWDLENFSYLARGVPMKVTGQLTAPDDGDYIGQVNIVVPEFNHNQMDGFWPEAARGRPMERWMLQKISTGTFSDIRISVPIKTVSKDRQLTLLAFRPSASFVFHQVRLDYRPPLYPVEQAEGAGHFDGETLDLVIDSARMRDLVFTKTTVKIEDILKPGAGQAHIKANLTGPLKTVLRYVTLDPIHQGEKIPVEIDDVGGQGDFFAQIDFPTIKNLPVDRVGVAIVARVKDVTLPKIVYGQTVSGGPFDVTVQNGEIGIKGSGQLEGRDLTVNLNRSLTRKESGGKMELTAHIVTDEHIRRNFGADLSFIEGPMPVDVVYHRGADDRAILDITADLTSAHLSYPAFGYEKESGSAGQASLRMHTKKNRPQSVSNMNVTAPHLNIQKGTLQFLGDQDAVILTSLNFPVFRFGAGDVALTVRRDVDMVTINANGKMLDLAPFMNRRKEGATGPRTNFNANVSMLSFGGQENMKNATLSATFNNQSDLERVQLDATVGGLPAAIHYVPNPKGDMTLSINAQNAGAFLRAMGIYNNMMGGRFTLSGQPIGNNNRDVTGDLVIKDFDVVRAPVLAQLINALSLDGIAEELGNKGIQFKRLESRFTWQRREEQDVMSFNDGRTSGAALGLTFDGVYDRRKKDIDISGTIIPLSGINTFISKIPLIGDVMIGGRGGALVAATYHVSGPGDKPRTTINPLSVLTPGILRRLLFESTPRNPINDTVVPE